MTDLDEILNYSLNFPEIKLKFRPVKFARFAHLLPFLYSARAKAYSDLFQLFQSPSRRKPFRWKQVERKPFQTWKPMERRLEPPQGDARNSTSEVPGFPT